MKRLKVNVELVIFGIGMALFVAGVYLIYPPAALISAGMIFMGISIFGGRV